MEGSAVSASSRWRLAFGHNADPRGEHHQGDPQKVRAQQMEDLHPQRRQQQLSATPSKLQSQQHQHPVAGLRSAGCEKLRSSSQQMKSPAITAVIG